MYCCCFLCDHAWLLFVCSPLMSNQKTGGENMEEEREGYHLARAERPHHCHLLLLLLLSWPSGTVVIAILHCRCWRCHYHIVLSSMVYFKITVSSVFAVLRHCCILSLGGCRLHLLFLNCCCCNHLVFLNYCDCHGELILLLLLWQFCILELLLLLLLSELLSCTDEI